MARAANEYFKLIEKQIRRGSTHMKGKTAAKMVTSLTNWGALNEEGQKIYTEPLLQIFTKGAERISRNLVTKQDRPDPIGTEAVNWAKGHSAELVTGITAETMLALRDVIQSGIDEGLAIQAIAKNVRAIAGLNERQALAAGNLLTRLEAAGLTDEAIEKTIGRYVNKAHRYRSYLIARTETASALSEGTRVAYGDMGIKRLQRVEDPNCCDICADHQGQIYTIAEAEGVLPEHPACEGAWVMAG